MFALLLFKRFENFRCFAMLLDESQRILMRTQQQDEIYSVYITIIKEIEQSNKSR